LNRRGCIPSWSWVSVQASIEWAPLPDGFDPYAIHGFNPLTTFKYHIDVKDSGSFVKGFCSKSQRKFPASSQDVCDSCRDSSWMKYIPPRPECSPVPHLLPKDIFIMARYLSCRAQRTFILFSHPEGPTEFSSFPEPKMGFRKEKMTKMAGIILIYLMGILSVWVAVTALWRESRLLKY